MILGDAVSKFKTFVWILNHISRSITWSLFIVKASNLVKWPISTWSFIWWVRSVYRLVKILKLAPVPWWISERLILCYSSHCAKAEFSRILTRTCRVHQNNLRYSRTRDPSTPGIFYCNPACFSESNKYTLLAHSWTLSNTPSIRHVLNKPYSRIPRARIQLKHSML